MAELISKKEKRVSFDLTDGRDELNLAEFPLFYLGQRVPQGLDTLTFQNEIHDPVRNKTVTRRFQLAASGAYGLPTAADADVLHALMLICKQATKLSSPVVTFSRYQLCEVLGWAKNGKNYKRIEQALRKWLTLTLFFDAWWDREGERWSNVQGFHLLEMVELNDVRGRRNEAELPLSSVRFSQEFFKSMSSGYVKKLNLSEYFHLKLPVSKQLYRFLDKRFYKKRTLSFEIKNLAFEHIGLSRNYTPTKIKEKMRPAILELTKIGFIEEMPDEERFTKRRLGDYQVHFTKSKSQDIGSLPLDGPKTVKIAHRQLMKQLTDFGMTASTARKLVEDPSISEDRIQQKMEMLNWYREKDSDDAPKNPGGWLRKAIIDDYDPPAGFQTAAELEEANRRSSELKQKKERAVLEKQQAEKREMEEAKSKDRMEWNQVQEYLGSLSGKDREELINAAINDDENGFIRSRVVKYLDNPIANSDSDVYYEMALKNHILPLLRTPIKAGSLF